MPGSFTAAKNYYVMNMTARKIAAMRETVRK
jgi:hypothetical protein